MEYMFLIYVDEAKTTAPSAEAWAQQFERNWAILDDAKAKGVYRGASPLVSPATAVTLRSSNGKITATDGPFAETKEVLGGYWLLECRDLAEARVWGERIAQTGCANSVEIRAIRPMPARADVPDPTDAAILWTPDLR
jgi:hypothetical protein